MKEIKRKFIVDKNNKKIAVQLDIETFTKMEEIIENYSLFHLMQENNDDEILGIKEAKQHYSKIKKAN